MLSIVTAPLQYMVSKPNFYIYTRSRKTDKYDTEPTFVLDCNKDNRHVEDIKKSLSYVIGIFKHELYRMSTTTKNALDGDFYTTNRG